MDVEDVAAEIGDKADTIAGLRVFRYPPDEAVNKAFVVGLPDITFDAAYGRGSDEATFPAWVLIEMTDARAAFTQLVKYLNGSGPESIKAAVDSKRITNEYTACDTVTVRSAEPGTFTWAGVEMLGAEFTITVTGSGS